MRAPTEPSATPLRVIAVVLAFGTLALALFLGYDNGWVIWHLFTGFGVATFWRSLADLIHARRMKRWRRAVYRWYTERASGLWNDTSKPPSS